MTDILDLHCGKNLQKNRFIPIMIKFCAFVISTGAPVLAFACPHALLRKAKQWGARKLGGPPNYPRQKNTGAAVEGLLCAMGNNNTSKNIDI